MLLPPLAVAAFVVKYAADLIEPGPVPAINPPPVIAKLATLELTAKLADVAVSALVAKLALVAVCAEVANELLVDIRLYDDEILVALFDELTAKLANDALVAVAAEVANEAEVAVSAVTL